MAIHTLSIDVETFSDVDLKNAACINTLSPLILKSCFRRIRGRRRGPYRT